MRAGSRRSTASPTHPSIASRIWPGSWRTGSASGPGSAPGSAAIDAGWFGPVEDRVRPRLGDVIVAGREPFTLVDSRTARPHTLSLIGQHGSLTADEQLVPLLVHRS